MDVKNVLYAAVLFGLIVMGIVIVGAILYIEWIAIAWLLMMVFGAAPWYVVLFLMITLANLFMALRSRKTES